jgi:hypothetical protein
MRIVRIAAVVVALGALAYGLFGERHEVSSAHAAPPTRLSGFAFIEKATYDGLARTRSGLYDIFDQAPATARVTECKT